MRRAAKGRLGAHAAAIRAVGRVRRPRAVLRALAGRRAGRRARRGARLASRKRAALGLPLGWMVPRSVRTPLPTPVRAIRRQSPPPGHTGPGGERPWGGEGLPLEGPWGQHGRVHLRLRAARSQDGRGSGRAGNFRRGLVARKPLRRSACVLSRGEDQATITRARATGRES